MKKLILLLLIAPFHLFAQKQYIIKGRVKNVQYPAKIFLSYRREGEKSHWDSTVVKNGEFTFKGTFPDTVMATLLVDPQGRELDDIWKKNNVDSKQIYLLNAAINIMGATSLAKAAVTGDKLNTDYYKFTLQTNLPDVRRGEAEKRFIKNNPDSYISLDQALKDLSRGYANGDSLAPVYEMLSAHIRSTPAGIAYRKYLDNLSTTAIGKTAPDFSQADTNGMPVKLSDFRGKYVLIDFWASWCHPCRMANPPLVKTYAKYKNQHFVIIGVSLDDPGAKSAWLKAIHHDGLGWLQLSDLKGWKNEVAQLYSVHAIPQNLLISPDGKIIAKDLFGDDLEKKLGEIFGKI